MDNSAKFFRLIVVTLAGLALLIGCGGSKSKSSPNVYGGKATSSEKISGKKESSGDDKPVKKETVVVSTRNRQKRESSSKVNESQKTRDAEAEASTPESSLEKHRWNATGAKEIYGLNGYVDVDDSAAAVDDEIWRQLDLANEYHALGVIANREGSWEEAQYYFEKGLGILADLDIEPESEPTPEDTKYSQVLDNIVADYRVALRSLGRLEEDVSAAVLVERFGNLSASLADTIHVHDGERKAVSFDIPIVINDRVKNSIVYFQTVARNAFEKYLRRSKRYTPMMKKILNEFDLPLDLIYLSLVESGYNPKAYSWARAMGLWQFIASTGRMYGLNRSWWVDERRDPVKSTRAACKFLKELYTRFGSWELAMAAYNGGPGRVSRTIKKQGTIDFWKLRLRRQTMDYVPLIMAAAIISKNPKRYGFYVDDFEAEVVWDEVTIDRCLDLKTVAKKVGCSLTELKLLNPELLRNYTPPNAKKYQLKIPVGKRKTFWAAYDKMPSPKETSWVRHKIRRGETVSTIASRYGVSQYAIYGANNLRTSRIYAGKSLIVPVPLDRSNRSKGKRNYDGYQAKNSLYLVRSGDTMWDIARAFGTTVSALRQANSIGRGSRIYVGQKLRIPATARYLKGKNKTGRGSSVVYDVQPGGNKKSASYKVRRGDTLWDIARKYGTTTALLRRINGLGRSSRIYPGQVLEISSSSDYITHKVRRGETLSQIARRYRTSIAKIRAHNNIDDPDQIPVGYRLRIYTR